jgi:hypothetical protein
MPTSVQDPRSNVANLLAQYGYTGGAPTAPNTPASFSMPNTAGYNPMGTRTGASLATASPVMTNTQPPGMGIDAKGIDWFGDKGIAIPGLQALTGVGQLALGFQALDETKKANKFNRKSAQLNATNQAQLVNQQLTDQYAARQGQSGMGANTAGYAERLAQYKADNTISGKI